MTLATPHAPAPWAAREAVGRLLSPPALAAEGRRKARSHRWRRTRDELGRMAWWPSLGREPMGPKELRSLNMVTAERKIIDVLLTFPRGPERSDALTDALTPPPETTETDDGDEVNDGRGDNLERDDDMLVGDEEEVFRGARQASPRWSWPSKKPTRG